MNGLKKRIIEEVKKAALEAYGCDEFTLNCAGGSVAVLDIQFPDGDGFSTYSTLLGLEDELSAKLKYLETCREPVTFTVYKLGKNRTYPSKEDTIMKIELN